MVFSFWRLSEVSLCLFFDILHKIDSIALKRDFFLFLSKKTLRVQIHLTWRCINDMDHQPHLLQLLESVRRAEDLAEPCIILSYIFSSKQTKKTHLFSKNQIFVGFIFQFFLRHFSPNNLTNN